MDGLMDGLFGAASRVPDVLQVGRYSSLTQRVGIASASIDSGSTLVTHDTPTLAVLNSTVLSSEVN